MFPILAALTGVASLLEAIRKLRVDYRKRKVASLRRRLTTANAAVRKEARIAVNGQFGHKQD